MRADTGTGLNVGADQAIMAYIRESRNARDLPRAGPFALLFTAATQLKFLNYAIPDDDTDPNDSEVAALAGQASGQGAAAEPGLLPDPA